MPGRARVVWNREEEIAPSPALVKIEDGSHSPCAWGGIPPSRDRKIAGGGVRKAQYAGRAWPRVPLERSRSKLVFLFQESVVGHQQSEKVADRGLGSLENDQYPSGRRTSDVGNRQSDYRQLMTVRAMGIDNENDQVS
jgi:hypothetical protein